VRNSTEKKRHVRKNPLVIHSSTDQSKQPLLANPKTRDNAGLRLKKARGPDGAGAQLRSGFAPRQTKTHRSLRNFRRRDLKKHECSWWHQMKSGTWYSPDSQWQIQYLRFNEIIHLSQINLKKRMPPHVPTANFNDVRTLMPQKLNSNPHCSDSKEHSEPWCQQCALKVIGNCSTISASCLYFRLTLWVIAFDWHKEKKNEGRLMIKLWLPSWSKWEERIFKTLPICEVVHA